VSASVSPRTPTSTVPGRDDAPGSPAGRAAPSTGQTGRDAPAPTDSADDTPACHTADTISVASTEHAPIEPAPARPVDWTDHPLKTKLLLLVGLSCAWGVTAGVMLGHFDQPWWSRLGAMLLLFGGLAWLAVAWVQPPIDQLLWALHRLDGEQRGDRRAALPTHRRDEIGAISRGLHRLQVAGRRHHHEASRLRRELDDRVSAATRKATAGLQQLAMRDPLTHLGNRRFLNAHFDRVIQSCLAAQSELTVVVMDLDRFKQVNDALGHAAGDQLLKLLADLCRSSARSEDLAVRLGGDEFAVVLPGCDAERAGERIARVRDLFREHVHRTLPPKVQPDISFGLASLHRDQALDGATLLERADQRLYAGKSGEHR